MPALAQTANDDGAHIGVPLPQSWHGELLGNVIDVSDREATARGYQTGGGQRMHTDSCDIIALMCVGAASIHFLARPHIFTMLLLSISVWMIEADRESPSRRARRRSSS